MRRKGKGLHVPPRHQVGPHSDEAHEAITAELVRLTLGGRGPERPELEVPR